MVITAKARGPESQLALHIRWEGDACVVLLNGELDLSTRDVLADALAAVAGSECIVIVDLSEVTFADCGGLAPLIEASARAGPRGGAVRLRNVPPSVERITGVTGPLADLFAPAPDR